MEDKVFQSLLDNGPFALLFCFLLFYVLRENAKREAKYQSLVDKLSTIIECKLESIEQKICQWMGGDKK